MGTGVTSYKLGVWEREGDGHERGCDGVSGVAGGL